MLKEKFKVGDSVHFIFRRHDANKSGLILNSIGYEVEIIGFVCSTGFLMDLIYNTWYSKGFITVFEQGKRFNRYTLGFSIPTDNNKNDIKTFTKIHERIGDLEEINSIYNYANRLDYVIINSIDVVTSRTIPYLNYYIVPKEFVKLVRKEKLILTELYNEY